MTGRGIDSRVDVPRWWGLFCASCGLPFLLYFHYAEGSDKGLLAEVSVALVMFIVGVFWNLRRLIIFWSTLGIFVILHVIAGVFVKFGHLKGPTLIIVAPFALVDFFIMYFTFQLIEGRAMKINATSYK